MYRVPTGLDAIFRVHSGLFFSVDIDRERKQVSLLRADHNRATQHTVWNPDGVRTMDAIYRVPTGSGYCGRDLSRPYWAG